MKFVIPLSLVEKYFPYAQKYPLNVSGVPSNLGVNTPPAHAGQYAEIRISAFLYLEIWTGEEETPWLRKPAPTLTLRSAPINSASTPPRHRHPPWHNAQAQHATPTTSSQPTISMSPALEQIYWHTRIDAGADETTVKAELKALAKETPEYKALGFQAYATAHLTPEIIRHRAAGKAIAAGADPAIVWPETERSSEPWMHTIPRRVLVSGLQSADKAWKNFFDSRTGARAGRLVGTPRFKRKSISRDSFTIPAPETIGAYGTAYLRGEPEYVRRKAQLKRRGIKTAPTIETTATYASHTWV